MTNAVPQGSPGAPQISHSSPSTGTMPRRTSYASVAAGTHNQLASGRSGAFSHLINPNAAFSTYTQNSSTDPLSRTPQLTGDPESQAEGGINIPGSWGRGRDTPMYSTPYALGQRYGWAGGGGTDSVGFFKPTYLRESKYMERLEAAYKAKVAAHREASSAHSSNPGSLSTSSSSVSLHKMTPSHRGMTYEIIEHQPAVEDDGLAQLPSKWAEVDKYGGLEIAADGLEVKYIGLSKLHDHEAAAARADHPMPPQCGIYYFEVTIISKGKEGMIGIGFSGLKASLEKFPGWESESWAYHGDDGKSFCCQSTGKNYGPTFTTGDVVGCGVNFMTGCAFFTKNGVFQGNAFRDLKDVSLYPSVGMKRPQAHLSVNFGQKPFVFDIDGMVAREKSSIGDEISSANVSNIYPRLDEKSLVKELVEQFLAHDGYVETAKAFRAEVQSEANALRSTPNTSFDGFAVEEDVDAVNRQRIRAAILDGDIDKALKLINAYYPHVLDDNRQIYFRLRCRKFVELIRQSTELLHGSTSKQSKSVNGHTNAVSDDDFEPEMDLDEQTNSVDDWDKMETEEVDSGLKYQGLLDMTLNYGRELKFEFRNDHSRHVENAFRDIFSMFAYEDPRKSPTAHLLDQAGRVPVAEELNSAILVSLGKSSSAAIERLYQQTEVLVSDISEEGGAGAFINVRNDFLR